ncbi:MAG: hypothetical protein KIS85_04185 [Anaerolineales bacterium]|nr:hypothetical protein [Anaerolineales bacterium]
MNVRKTISEELEDLLSSCTPEVRYMALALRDLIFEIEPRAKEQIEIKAGVLGYGIDVTYTNIICVVVLHADHVNLSFPRGVDSRQVKIRERSQVHSAEIAALLKDAVELTHRLR